MLRAWPALLLLLLSARMAAAESCSFLVSAQTWTLEEDCATDVSIELPDGITLDGAGHTIIAIDPTASLFRGGVIVNGGGSASVLNLTISALMLGDVCQTGRDRLRGIYFDGAAGAIRGNTILNVNKGQSVCQEGNGIEVRNTDLSGPMRSVEIAGNTVEGYQKTGIVVSGQVDAEIRSNSIGGSATQPLMAANAIQVGNGARADVLFNTVSGNSWNGDAASTAILLVSTAPGTTVRGNLIVGNADVGIFVMADGVRVERNRLSDSGPDGAFDIGIGNYGEDNVFDDNSITGFRIPSQNATEPRSIDATTVAGLN